MQRDASNREVNASDTPLGSVRRSQVQSERVGDFGDVGVVIAAFKEVDLIALATDALSREVKCIR